MKNITITLTPKEAWVLWHLANSDGFTSGEDANDGLIDYKKWDMSRKDWRRKTRNTADNIWAKIDKKFQSKGGFEEFEALRG
jgi:hypothetical protein